MLQAIFTTGVKTTEVSGLTQWDKGRTLTVTCAELPENFEAHFSFKGSVIAYVVKATAADGVSSDIPIPNIITRQNRNAVCWIYVTNGTMEKTTKTVELPIKPRQKPADYIYEEDDILTFEKMIAYTETVIERAETAESNAKTSETNAKESEESAKDALAGIRAIVAGNEAYTKYESDRKYSGAIICEASGTEVVIDDGSDSPFVDFGLYGKGEQKEYSGKNKLNTSGLKQATSNGVTYTPVYDDNGMLLYVEASGIATANSYYAISTFDYTEDCYLSGSPEGASANTYRIFDDILQKYDYGEGVLIEGGSSGKIYCMVISGVTVNKIRFKPMIRPASETDSTYEPYVGGIPAPNPDYPQEIVNVGHKSRQLFDASKIPTATQGGATVTNNGDGTFTVSGSGILTETFARHKDYTHEESIKLVKSGLLKANYMSVTRPFLYFEIHVGGEYVGEVANASTAIKQLEIPESWVNDPTFFIRMGVYGNKDSAIIPGIIKPMVYQDGDGTWEPFSDKYILPIKARGKNLLAIENRTVTVNGITFVSNKDGSITANGTATANAWFEFNSIFTLKPGNYCLSGCPVGGAEDKYALQVYEFLSSGNMRVAWQTYGNTICYTVTQERICTGHIVIRSGMTVKDLTFYPMLCTEHCEYEPYRSHTEFIELDHPLMATKDGSVRDKLYLDGTVERKIYNWILDSTFVVHTYNDDGSAWINIPNTGMIGSSKVLSNRFRASNDMRISTTGNTCRIPSSAGIYTSDDATFREFVTNNETYIQYPLATPITETLPESEIAKLRRLQTFNPTTIITADGGEMEIEYVADTKRYIDNKFKELEQALANTNAQLL